MSTDYAEKERDFIASLREDTGRDLAGWMTAIAQSGLNERNAIIDWLRHQGFQFARASWIERIHHNGGKLIYAGDPQQRSRAPATSRRIEDEVPPEPLHRVQLVVPTEKPPDADIQKLLAEAKGLRPLAEHILREIAGAVPDAAFAATNALIMISAPAPFAALMPGPKKLRLYANFGQAGAGRTNPADTVNRSPPPFSDMLLLDDARSVDDEFRRLIRAAAARR